MLVLSMILLKFEWLVKCVIDIRFALNSITLEKKELRIGRNNGGFYF